MSQAMPAPETLPEEVERLALLDWKLFPTYPRRRTTPKGAKEAATADLDQLAAWARDIPGCGWKVALGKSGLWAIDLDAPSPDHVLDGAATMRRLLAEPGRDLVRDDLGRPRLPMLRSGGGGWAWIFAHRGEKVRGSSRKDLPGLDPLRGEQAITVPPTLHHRTAAPYRWINAPWNVTEQPAPPWLLALFEEKPPPAAPRPEREASSERAERRLYDAVSRVSSAGDGNRNNTLNRETFMLGQWVAEGHIGETYVRTSMYEAAMMAGLEPRQSVTTIDAALRRARTMPRRA